MVKEKKSSERSIKISKSIIIVFVGFYLIFYGLIISMFIDTVRLEDPLAIPSFVNFFPYLCYFGSFFMFITLFVFIKNSNEQKSREHKSKRKGKMSLYKQALLLLVFIFVFVPLLSPIIDQGKNDQNFSVYNEEWNGCSTFRESIIEEGYEVGCIQSSLSATQRLNKSQVLVLLGPNTFYNPIYEIPYFIEFFKQEKNSIFLCHDHGSTSTLLYEIAFASVFTNSIPITFFPDGILRDNASCLENAEGKKDSAFPIIRNFEDHPTTKGVSSVILSKSSVSLSIFTYISGWTTIGTTSLFGFLDKNNDEKYVLSEDGAELPVNMGTVLGNKYPDYSNELKNLDRLPTGGFPQIPFMAKDTGTARIFVSADASLFNNELIATDHDNLKFGLNIIEWLTYGNKDDYMIIFDEAHIRPETSRDMSSAGIFGFIMSYIVQLSTNPFTAWIYPLLAIYTLRKYVPKKDKAKEEKKKAEEEEKKEEKAKFRTSSFFAQKIEWYHKKRRYEKALTLLYRRLERKLNAQLQGRPISTNNVVNFVRDKEGHLNRAKEKRLTNFMNKIINVKTGKTKIRRQEEFEKLFYEMEWAAKNV